MQADKLISSRIESVTSSTTGKEALNIMSKFRTHHLAVVEKEIYLNIISDKEILDWNSQEEKIKDHLPNLASPYVLYNQHLFDIVEIVEKNNLSVIPVLNKDTKYQGVITNKKLLYTIAKSSGVQSTGSIFVIEINDYDYSLSEISRIIESNDTKILSLHITSIPNSRKIEVTIKVNQINIRPIIKDLERHSYNIINLYKENQEDNDRIMKRYLSLMKFINP